MSKKLKKMLKATGEGPVSEQCEDEEAEDDDESEETADEQEKKE
jgi:hypothetical protein